MRRHRQDRDIGALAPYPRCSVVDLTPSGPSSMTGGCSVTIECATSIVDTVCDPSSANASTNVCNCSIDGRKLPFTSFYPVGDEPVCLQVARDCGASGI